MKDIIHIANISFMPNLSTLHINDNPFCKTIYIDILFLMGSKLSIIDGKKNENENLEILKQKTNFPKIFQNLFIMEKNSKENKSNNEVLIKENQNLQEENMYLKEKIENLEAQIEHKNQIFEIKGKEIQDKAKRFFLNKLF